ncbi:hypothetical protein MAUB1S_04071 [Mycolicibacterium aubagnense]
MFDDLQPREQHRQECGDQFFHRQIPHAGLDAVARRPRLGQLDEPIDVVRHLDSGEVLGAVLGIAHRDGEVDAQAADERKRVRRVDGQRCQHREHLIVEICGQLGLLALVELAPVHDGDALLGQRRTDRFTEHRGLPGRDLLGAFADPTQLLARGQPVRRPDRQAGLVTALQPGDPNHVELIEIRREDRQKLGLLQQRQRPVGSERQHPGIEVQPAQLTVEVAVIR